MQTHTIRNKASPSPIATFAPKFFEALLRASPEASSLTLGWLTQQYKQLTGKSLVIDHRQVQVLLVHARADVQGVWSSRFSQLPSVQYRLVTTFERGFLSSFSGLDLEEALELAGTFYQMMETAYCIPPHLTQEVKPET